MLRWLTGPLVALMTERKLLDLGDGTSAFYPEGPRDTGYVLGPAELRTLEQALGAAVCLLAVVVVLVNGGEMVDGLAVLLGGRSAAVAIFTAMLIALPAAFWLLLAWWPARIVQRCPERDPACRDQDIRLLAARRLGWTAPRQLRIMLLFVVAVFLGAAFGDAIASILPQGSGFDF